MTAPRLEADWLRAGPLAHLLGVLDRDGEEARVVGGAVRNALLGIDVVDIDVATTAVPEDVVRRVGKAGFKAVPTGIDHGTVTVVVDGRPFEVTTLREDVETYGRKAKVAFGRDWKRDAERRDFTMNALSVTADGSVHDYVGGLADLKRRAVRFIGNPAMRIAEDHLRILRFFRCHAAYGEGAPDAAGLHACVAARASLDALSRERVRAELFKLLLARHAVAMLALMLEYGLLGPILGGVPFLASFENMIKVEAASATPADPVRRLGALGVFVVEDAERLWQRLRLANAEHERLASMGESWWRVAPVDANAGRALLYRLGSERYVDRVLVAWARSWEEGAADVAWRDFAALPQRWTPPIFPLSADDFMRRGVAKGPALGAALRAAETAWIAADFTVDKAALAAIITKVIAAA
ncbi:MAG: CCA tRNA nucleotidyltransferase [Rhizobiales bacterium]|nr:CCA tRNA nucleotidyltransferase [Hyphomicrobiales bacterium]